MMMMMIGNKNWDSLKYWMIQVQKYVVIYWVFYLEVAQGRMNGAPNETWTHSCRFASLAC